MAHSVIKMSTLGTVVIRQSVRIVACKVQHVSEYPVMIMAAVYVMTMSRRKTLGAILSSDVQVNQHFEPSLANYWLYVGNIIFSLVLLIIL